MKRPDKYDAFNKPAVEYRDLLKEALRIENIAIFVSEVRTMTFVEGLFVQSKEKMIAKSSLMENTKSALEVTINQWQEKRLSTPEVDRCLSTLVDSLNDGESVESAVHNARMVASDLIKSKFVARKAPAVKNNLGALLKKAGVL